MLLLKFMAVEPCRTMTRLYIHRIEVFLNLIKSLCNIVDDIVDVFCANA